MASSTARTGSRPRIRLPEQWQENYVGFNLLLMVLGLIGVLMVSWTPAHRLICHNHAGDQSTMLDWSVSALRLRLEADSVALQYARTTETLGYSADLRWGLREVMLQKQDSVGVRTLPVGVDSLLLTHFVQYDMVAISYVGLRTDSVGMREQPMFIFGDCLCRYDTSDPLMHRAQLKLLFERLYTANCQRWWPGRDTAFAVAVADSDVIAAFDQAERHVRFPLATPRFGLIAFVCGLVVSLGLSSYLIAVRDAIVACAWRRDLFSTEWRRPWIPIL